MSIRESDPRRDLGLAFETENEQEDLARWRVAPDSERSRVIAELIEHAERVAATTGIRNEEPASRFPAPRWQQREGDGS